MVSGVLWSVARAGEQCGSGGAAATLLEVSSVVWCLQSAGLTGQGLSSAWLFPWQSWAAAIRPGCHGVL